MSSLLEFVKVHLRIDHNAFDDHITQLIKSAQASMRVAGVTINEESDVQQICIMHFVDTNFKNGQMTNVDEFKYSKAFHHALEQARYE